MPDTPTGQDDTPTTSPDASDAAALPPLVRAVALGPWMTNCYVVSTHSGEACWIVDAGMDPLPLIEMIRDRGLRPMGIVLTHAHVDHIAGIPQLFEAFGEMPVLLHQAEASWLDDPTKNLSVSLGGEGVRVPGPTRTIADGEVLDLAGTAWRVAHVPGHSPGNVALVCVSSAPGNDGVAIVGDSLFAGSIGRTDLPGGDSEQLLASIRAKLYTLPPSTRVLCGHGPETTIARERTSNPFVRADDE